MLAINIVLYSHAIRGKWWLLCDLAAGVYLAKDRKNMPMGMKVWENLQ